MDIRKLFKRGSQEQRQRRRAIAREAIKAGFEKDLKTPFPTVWDLLHQATHKPVFGKIAEFVRPGPEDVGAMVGPLGAGVLSKHAAKELPALLRGRFIENKPQAAAELTELLKQEIPTKVGIPTSLVDFPKHVHKKALKGIQNFVAATAALPKGALSRVKRVDYLPNPFMEGIAGTWDPRLAEALIEFSPKYKPRSVIKHTPQMLTHETTHSLAEQENLYNDVLDYLSNVGWKYRRDLTEAERRRIVGRGDTPEPTVYDPNPTYAPKTYRRLAAADYGVGWPLEGWPSAMPPREWSKMVSDWPSFTLKRGDAYALSHPIEDIAEAGSYAMLEAMPSNFALPHAKEINALRADPRYAMIRKLLQKAGVDI